ncbi:AEC family transporter [Salicibibacter kimchii]|uniref:AEC family transporter n=1 Tax=Salicibibacter kimchii TaxID=2099786 RepID=A0A345BVR3_9BACI|nr:AEC family transporter [Salicibibacter kimchii]AXF55044.1 AEC family transporter [Salicibibacter kimchii]
MDTFLAVFREMSMLYIIFAAGWVAMKTGILPETSRGVFTRLLLYVTLPCLIVTSLHVPFEMDRSLGVFTLLMLSAYFLISTAFIGKWTARWLKLPQERSGVYENLLLFGNQGYIGVALVLQLFGQNGLFFAMVFNMLYFIMIWTYGIAVMQREKPHTERVSLWVNPGFIATTIGFVFFFLPMSLPQTLFGALESIGEMTIPLSMLLIGCLIAAVRLHDLKRFLCSPLLWSVVSARLFILPFFLFLPFVFTTIPFEWLVIAVLISATPSAPTVSLYADNYGGDTAFASVSVFVSTLVAVVTLPLLFGIFHAFH